MDDLISRQAAIDAVDVLCQEHRYRIPGKRETYSQYNEAWQDALDRAEVAIGNLPSVRPATNCSEIPNGSDDTISRQAVTKFLNDWLSCLFENCHKQSASDLKMIIKDFKNMPSAQPEIIRCKDCEYGEQDEVGRWFCRSLGCQIGNEDGSGFCADAERRTDG